MLTQSINKLLEIEVKELSSWDIKPHKHNFFVIVYVEKGFGVQCINQIKFEYQAGHIFLLPPLNCHEFKIIEPSRFYFIRFTDNYFINDSGLTNYNSWFERIAYILDNYDKVPGDIISSESEREYIVKTIKTIYHEHVEPDCYSEPIITNAVASILNILARGIEKKHVEQSNEADNRFREILRYISIHITSRDKLSIAALAHKFSISKTYFSEYFKKQAGSSLSEYILKSKLRLVEAKAKHTDLSIKEMAYQLNFTDSSHLAKSFKKAYGMTIKEFKQRFNSCNTDYESKRAIKK